MAQIDFVEKGKKSRYPNLFNTINIRTIHSLCGAIFKKLFNKGTENLNTLIYATRENLLNIERKELLKINCLKNIKFIFIDEAQDINKYQYDLVKLLSEKLDVSLILVGDPNQAIYGFQGGSDTFLLMHNENKNYLNNNYRSTKEIIDFCNYLRPHETLPNMEYGKLKNGMKPKIINDTIEKLKIRILDEIKNDEYDLKDIAIIGPVKKSRPSANGNYKSFGLQLIRQFLDDNNIKYVTHYKDGDEDEKYTKDFKPKDGYLNIMTAHGSKGLEFKKVLILNYHFHTFTKKPSEKEYNNFKFLWYVALTRAIEKLIIFVDNTKDVFYELFKIPEELYIREGKILNKKPDRIIFAGEMVPESFSVTEIIKNNEYFDEKVKYDFKKKFNFIIEKEEIFENFNKISIFEEEKYSSLYGDFIEKLFTYYYFLNKNKLDEFVKNEIKNLNNIFIVKKSYFRVFRSLCNKNFVMSIDDEYIMYIDMIDKDSLTNEEYNFVYKIIYEKLKSNVIQFYIENDVFDYNKEYLIKLNEKLLLLEKNEEILFEICVYFYQFKNEAKVLLKYDFTNNINSLRYYFDFINDYSKKCINGYEFQKKTIHSNLSIIGIIDVLIENKIVDIKFTNSMSDDYVIQVLLYYNNYFQDWKPDKNLEIWNFKDGFKYMIKFDGNINNWDLNCFLCDILKIKMINNVFILDLETNNIDENEYCFDLENIEIIDRYVYEFNLDYVISEGLIKNNYKLTTTHITKITEDMMQNVSDTLDTFKNDMKKINNYCNNPTFIAHNGNMFDFKILQNVKILEKENRYVDTKNVFRLFVKDKNFKSNKLIDIYNYLFNIQHEQKHRAKEDVFLIVEILKYLKINCIDITNLTYNFEI